MKVVLAGEYPQGTYENFKIKFENNPDIEFIKVDNIDDYNKMEDAEIIILRIFKAKEEVIKRNKKLKMIVRWGAGYDSVDIKAAGEQGVIVTNTPGVNAQAVAELTILLMLALNRKLLNHIESLKNGHWSKNTFLNQSFTLSNKTIGIIGGGNIGKTVARLLNSFEARVIYYDPYRMNLEEEKRLSMEYRSLENLLKEADIVTLHIPLLESTKHIIGKAEIVQMKQGALLINTSRGGLIDEEALLEGIKTGKIRGAGLDGVENEPLKKDDELLKYSNVIVTPHVGGGTIDLSDKIIPVIVEDILKFLYNQDISHIVNKKFLKKNS